MLGTVCWVHACDRMKEPRTCVRSSRVLLACRLSFFLHVGLIYRLWFGVHHDVWDNRRTVIYRHEHDIVRAPARQSRRHDGGHRTWKKVCGNKRPMSRERATRHVQQSRRRGSYPETGEYENEERVRGPSGEQQQPRGRGVSNAGGTAGGDRVSEPTDGVVVVVLLQALSSSSRKCSVRDSFMLLDRQEQGEYMLGSGQQQGMVQQPFPYSGWQQPARKRRGFVYV